jgi:hypothetical protein
MTNVAAMNLLQLAMRVVDLPERRELWTPFDYAVRDEYDRRIIAAEQAGRAA